MLRTRHRHEPSSVKTNSSGRYVGLLCSIHSCSYLLNAFENPTHWVQDKRNKTVVSKPNFQDRFDGTESQQRLFVPPSDDPRNVSSPLVGDLLVLVEKDDGNWVSNLTFSAELSMASRQLPWMLAADALQVQRPSAGHDSSTIGRCRILEEAGATVRATHTTACAEPASAAAQRGSLWRHRRQDSIVGANGPYTRGADGKNLRGQARRVLLGGWCREDHA